MLRGLDRRDTILRHTSPKQFGDVISGLLRPKLPQECHYEFKDFLDGCWNSDAKKRPNFETICHILDDPTMSRLDQLNLTKAKTRVMCMESEKSSHSIPLSIPAYLKIKFFSENVNINNLIARGSNRVNKSEVYRATWLGCDFAVKRLWFSCDGTSNRLKHLSAVQREIEFLIKLRHPHIVQLVGISLHPGVTLSGCSIVMEIMSSNLDVLIEKRLSWTQSKRSVLVKIGPLDLHEAVVIVRKIASGMAYLHSKGVVHGNLNPRNVMVKEIAENMTDVKITDFGDSYDLKGTRPFLCHSDSRNCYMAPEVLELKGIKAPSVAKGNSDPRKGKKVPSVAKGNSDHRKGKKVPSVAKGNSDHRKGKTDDEEEVKVQKFTEVEQDDGVHDKYSELDLKAADIYSFATTCYKVFTGKEPDHYTEHNLYNYRESVTRGDRPELPANLHSDLKLLINKCWHVDPSQRPNFTYIEEELRRIYKALPRA